MEQPHGFTFTDHTGDDTDDETNEEFERLGNENEVVFYDPEEVKLLQSIMRMEERDGQQVFVIKDYQLFDEVYTDYWDYWFEPDDYDPALDYSDDDEDGFDDEDDDDLPEDLARFIAFNMWASLDWNDPESLTKAAAFVARSLTPAMLELINKTGRTSVYSNPEPELTQALAASGVVGAVGTAADITTCAHLGRRLNHMRENHSKRELKAWQSRAAQALGEHDWNELAEDHPNIESFATAFRRFNDAGCRMDQLVRLEDGMWDARIVATDGESGYRLELSSTAPDNNYRLELALPEFDDCIDEEAES